MLQENKWLTQLKHKILLSENIWRVLQKAAD